MNAQALTEERNRRRIRSVIAYKLDEMIENIKTYKSNFAPPDRKPFYVKKEST